MADAGLWNRKKHCNEGRSCYWYSPERFHPWCRDVWHLWVLCLDAEGFRDKSENERVRFMVNWAALNTLRLGGHPAFAYPSLEPWEIMELMRWLASNQCQDPGAQHRALNG